MNSNDHLSVTESVEEVRARGEDRLIDLLVPRLDHLADVVTEAAANVREKLHQIRAH